MSQSSLFALKPLQLTSNSYRLPEDSFPDSLFFSGGQSSYNYYDDDDRAAEESDIDREYNREKVHDI